MGHVPHICGNLTNLDAGKESFVLEAKLHTHAAQLRQQRVLHSADLCQISIVQEGSVTTRSEHWNPQVQKDAQQIQLARLKVGDCELSTSWNVEMSKGCMVGGQEETSSMQQVAWELIQLQRRYTQLLDKQMLPKSGHPRVSNNQHMVLANVWKCCLDHPHPWAKKCWSKFSVALLWKLLKIETLRHLSNPSCQSSQVHVGRLWCSAGRKADQGGFSFCCFDSLPPTRFGTMPSGVVCGSPKLCPQRSQARGDKQLKCWEMMTKPYIHCINRYINIHEQWKNVYMGIVLCSYIWGFV